MLRKNRVFPMEQVGDVLIVSPTSDSLAVEETQLVREINSLHDAVTKAGVRHLVIDLGGAPYFGSLVLGAIIALTGKVRSLGGRPALCAAKAGVHDALEITRVLDVVPYYQTREEALAAVREEGSTDGP
jgi:anti-anti-sigma factor